MSMLVAVIIGCEVGFWVILTLGLIARYGLRWQRLSTGHRTISALDQRVAHRFAGAPAPIQPVRNGIAQTKRQWQQWRRALLGWAVASALLLTATVLVNDPAKTFELDRWLWGLSGGLAVWLVAGPLTSHARHLRNQ